MTTTTLADLAGGVHVHPKRGPEDGLHAVSWKANTEGARRAACGKVGRFVPPFGQDDFAAFPTFDAVNQGTPPRCARCLLAKPDHISKAAW